MCYNMREDYISSKYDLSERRFLSLRAFSDAARASEDSPEYQLPANTNRAAMRTHNLYFTEISEKGKPSERAGRKAMGSNANPLGLR